MAIACVSKIKINWMVKSLAKNKIYIIQDTYLDREYMITHQLFSILQLFNHNIKVERYEKSRMTMTRQCNETDFRCHTINILQQD